MTSVSDQMILSALGEDYDERGDVTSEAIFSIKHQSVFQLSANQSAILAGLEVFEKTFYLLDESIQINSSLSNASKLVKGQIICTLKGSARTILKGERTALNFLSHLSGIATVTNELVQLIENTGCVLLDTRKTTPNLRLFEKQAVIAGGARNHRFNLSEMVLIKDNHIAAAGSLKSAVAKVRFKYDASHKIEVEVQNKSQLEEAIESGVDIIMFDNWFPDELKSALKLVPKSIETEASGMISKGNIREYALTGVNYISSSYMVKNADWIDFSLSAIPSS